MPFPSPVVMTSFEPGGTERQMIELVRRLDPARWAVHLACFHARGTWFERIAGIGRVGRRVSRRQLQAVRTRCGSSGRSRSGAATAASRVVHTTELYSNIFGLPGAALAGVPVRIGSRRGMNGDKSRGLVALQRAGLLVRPRRRRQLAGGRRAACRTSACPDHKIAVIPNGLDLERRSAADRSRPAPRRVVVVANLRPRKGPRRPDRRGSRRSYSACPGRDVRVHRRRPRTRARSIALAGRRRGRARLYLRRPPRRRPGPPRGGRHLRAAVEVRGVSERDPRSDGRRPADRRLGCRRDPRADRRRSDRPARAAGRRAGARRRGPAAIATEPGLAARLGDAARVAAETPLTRSIAWSTAFDACYRVAPSTGSAACRWQGPRAAGVLIMCGIAGIVAADGLDQDAPARAVRMRDVMSHRGPDEAGLHCDAHAALAHRRLSIVDLGTGSSRCRTRTAASGSIFNGEIYNHADAARRARARTATSTAPSPTPRRSSTPTSSGATRACTASAACSRSRSGTRRSGGCCWSAIGSASSRSTGRMRRRRCSSARRSRRSSPAG